jgi:4-hydroxybenzoate polyprenyltransferase
LTALALAGAAGQAGVGWPFWPLWLLAAAGMQREALGLRRTDLPRSSFGRHFSRQVLLGGLLLLALVVGRL